MIDSAGLKLIARSSICERVQSQRVRDRLQGKRQTEWREIACFPNEELAKMTDNEMAQVAAELLAMRRRRYEALAEELIGEAAWDILLSAYSSPNEIMQTKELCALSTLPEATAIRWLQVLEQRRFLERAVHPIRRDQRATYYRLTAFGRLNVEQALEAMLHA